MFLFIVIEIFLYLIGCLLKNLFSLFFLLNIIIFEEKVIVYILFFWLVVMFVMVLNKEERENIKFIIVVEYFDDINVCYYELIFIVCYDVLW